MISNTSFFCCILHHYRVHHWLSTSACLAHSVNRNIRSRSVKSQRSQSMGVNVNIFIIFSIPSFIMQVQKIWPDWCLYY
jgi:hypothetical protein